MKKYAYNDLAQEFLARADEEGSRMRRLLEISQLLTINEIRNGVWGFVF